MTSNMIFDVTGSEERIGYSFKNKMLLRQCFTHSSYANESGGDDNEVLEFFGDAILEFIVTEYLYKNAYAAEGKLTDMRKNLVSKAPLQEAVFAMKADEFLLLGNGLKDSTKREKLYSSLYEALVAGIYLDGGMEQAKKFIFRTLPIGDILTSEKCKTASCDSKSSLQEYVQKYKLGKITYREISKKGPDHAPIFRVAVEINERAVAEGAGQSKKQAEASAAEKALTKINKLNKASVKKKKK